MTDFRLAPATRQDAPAIMEVHRKAILGLGPPFYSPEACESWAAGLTPQIYLDAMTQGGERYIKALRAGDTVGFCAHTDDRIMGLYVDPAASRAGIGSALLGAAEAAMQAPRITLKAALSALAFYGAHGYSVTGQEQWQTRGGLMIDVRCMQKDMR